jgi:Tol biopolymer transport system component
MLLAIAIGCGGSGGGSSTNGTVGATAATTGTLGNFPPDVIFYSRTDGFNETFYRIDPDGSNNTVVASYPSNYTAFAPSPVPADSRVAFAYQPDQFGQENGVYVNTSVDATGATTIDAGPFVFVGSMQFNPDGTKLIYVALRATDENAGVYIANADGTGTPVRLDDADDAHLSPSGTKLVYSRFMSGDSEICLRNTDGTGFAQITSNTANDYYPQWSKDGMQIFFTTDRVDAVPGIWRMTANGTGAQAVTASNDEYASSPNSDASQVAFIRLSFNSEENGLYVVDVDGSNETPVELQTDISPMVYWTSTNGRSVGNVPNFAMSRLSPRIESYLRKRH